MMTTGRHGDVTGLTGFQGIQVRGNLFLIIDNRSTPHTSAPTTIMQTRSNKTTRGNRRKSSPPPPSIRKRATSTADVAKAQKKTRLDDSNNDKDEAATEGRKSGKKMKKGKARLVTTAHPLITIDLFTGHLRLLGLIRMLLPQCPPTLRGVFFLMIVFFI